MSDLPANHDSGAPDPSSEDRPNEQVHWTKLSFTNALHQISGLTFEEMGALYLVSLLIGAENGAISQTSHKLHGPKRQARTIAKVLNALASKELIYLEDGLIKSRAVENDLKASRNYLRKKREDGRKGGRPRKENNDLQKPLVSSNADLTSSLDINTYKKNLQDLWYNPDDETMEHIEMLVPGHAEVWVGNFNTRFRGERTPSDELPSKIVDWIKDRCGVH